MSKEASDSVSEREEQLESVRQRMRANRHVLELYNASLKKAHPELASLLWNITLACEELVRAWGEQRDE